MATWRERLLQASFSGVPFVVTDSEDTGGMRAAVHEYPLRDRPFVEELGRKARRVTVRGFLIGDDCQEQRKRLIAKLEGASPGFPHRPGRTLVHPTLGAMKVLCLGYRTTLSTEDGRTVGFSAEFTEVGEELEPTAQVAPAGAADAASQALSDGAGASFAENVQTVGVIEQAREAVAGVVREAIARIRALDVFSGPLRDVQRLERSLSSLAGELSTLITAPADLAAGILGSISNVRAAAASPLGALEAYRALRDFPPGDFGGGSQGAIASENSRLTAELVSLGAIGGAATAAARADFETLEAAEETRDDLFDELDRLQGEVSDTVLPLLDELRSVIARTVPAPGSDLPSLRTLTLPDTTPALVLAHTLYQDVARDQEIADRNHVRNPARVPGLTPILVLSS